MHPLLDLMIGAADGRFPSADGAVTIVPALARRWECSFAFTGHAVVATELPADEVVGHGADGFGGD